MPTKRASKPKFKVGQVVGMTLSNDKTAFLKIQAIRFEEARNYEVPNPNAFISTGTWRVHETSLRAQTRKEWMG